MESRRSNAEFKSKGLVTFAPSFHTSANPKDDLLALRSSLHPLRHNESEANKASEILGGKVYLAESATKNNFLKEAQHAKILHLATHGKSNGNSGDLSYIAFTHSSDSLENENVLYVSELYSQSIPADLVVLSACETGIGELKSGEGLIGLTRGFMHAGAKSVLTSLWNINDAQSPKIFSHFYKNIKDGMGKSQALQQAKLSYIRKEKKCSSILLVAIHLEWEYRPC